MQIREYNPGEIEKKWQDIWEEKGIFHASRDKSKPKYFTLVEFPYPSGNGLHVGHPRSYTALDIISRKRRMEGYNVLYPIGWDAFGLPTENFAIKNRIHPKIVTENNVARFKSQLKSIGFSFDWSRQVNTTDPSYYRWTQWIFLQIFDTWFDEVQERGRPIEVRHRLLLVATALSDLGEPLQAAAGLDRAALPLAPFEGALEARFGVVQQAMRKLDRREDPLDAPS